MKLIEEALINKMLEAFEDELKFQSALTDLVSEQPDLAAFIDSDTQSLLNDQELSLLEFLVTVIYTCCKQTLPGKIDNISGAMLENMEEKNWEIFNAQGNKQFHNILDIFFQEYPQEDLLALVEDSLQEDEDSFVTGVGKEIIFIACKSVIDVLHQH
jgi:hypothetical protein